MTVKNRKYPFDKLTNDENELKDDYKELYFHIEGYTAVFKNMNILREYEL